MPSILPYSMQDESNLALENCINQAFDIDMSKFLTCINDNLSDDVLLAKAKMFHTLGNEGWNDCETREDKISLLNNVIRTHRFKGTVYSIRSRLVNVDLEYLAWHQYNGTPNHFKIIMYVEEAITAQVVQKLSLAVNEYKRFSAKMDELEIYTTLKDRLDINTSVIKARKVVIQ